MGGVELIGISGASRLVYGYGWRYLCGRDDISGAQLFTRCLCGVFTTI